MGRKRTPGAAREPNGRISRAQQAKEAGKRIAEVGDRCMDIIDKLARAGRLAEIQEPPHFNDQRRETAGKFVSLYYTVMKSPHPKAGMIDYYPDNWAEGDAPSLDELTPEQRLRLATYRFNQARDALLAVGRNCYQTLVDVAVYQRPPASAISLEDVTSSVKRALITLEKLPPVRWRDVFPEEP